MKHYLKEIQADPFQLSKEVKDHIKVCKSCQKEQYLMQEIIQGLKNMPAVAAPSMLEARLFSSLRQGLADTKLKTWHYLLMIVVAMFSPHAMQNLYSKKGVLVLPSGYEQIVTISFALLGVSIAVALAIHLSEKSPRTVEKFEKLIMRVFG